MNNEKEIFQNIFLDLKQKGKLVSPRGDKVLEIENYNYVLPPYVRFCNFEARKLNLKYIKEEFKWYLKGDRFDLSICNHAKMWDTIKNEDGSINSNYGQYIFGGINQFTNIINTLLNDKDSRRASIMILSKDHLLSITKDYPCTYSLNFRIRENKLNMTVRMRSQDAVWGLGPDAACFSFIHELVYVYLKDTYSELELGEYYHSADSFHIYERHFNMLEKIIDKDSVFVNIDCPKIENKLEAEALINGIFAASFKFSNWLVNN